MLQRLQLWTVAHNIIKSYSNLFRSLNVIFTKIIILKSEQVSELSVCSLRNCKTFFVMLSRVTLINCNIWNPDWSAGYLPPHILSEPKLILLGYLGNYMAVVSQQYGYECEL